MSQDRDSLTNKLAWKDVCAVVEKRRGTADAEQVARELRPLRFNKGYVYLQAKNNPMRDWMDYKFSGDLLDVCVDLEPAVTRVVIIA